MERDRAKTIAALIGGLGTIIACGFGVVGNVVASWLADSLQQDLWTVAAIAVTLLLASVLIFLLLEYRRQ